MSLTRDNIGGHEVGASSNRAHANVLPPHIRRLHCVSDLSRPLGRLSFCLRQMPKVRFRVPGRRHDQSNITFGEMAISELPIR
jgi:hypothetical protein